MWTFAAIPSSSAGNRGSQGSIKKRHKWLSWTVSYDNVGSWKVGKAGYGQSQKYSPRIWLACGLSMFRKSVNNGAYDWLVSQGGKPLTEQ